MRVEEKEKKIYITDVIFTQKKKKLYFEWKDFINNKKFSYIPYKISRKLFSSLQLAAKGMQSESNEWLNLSISTWIKEKLSKKKGKKKLIRLLAEKPDLKMKLNWLPVW